MTIAELVDAHTVVVCVGSGGVGKTTMAASTALYAASRGRRAMVLTIDPARRLAQSLGLETLRAGGEKIPTDCLTAAGLPAATTLSAGMLDQKSAWDDLIRRHAPSEEAVDAILGNRFYQQLSQSFAGSTEYMAVEELYRIRESGEYDLIVLDTPPSSHALDFLEAPERLRELLDASVIGWLVGPSMAAGWTAWKTASRSARFLFEKIEVATGTHTLGEISAFFVAMERLFDGLSERSAKVKSLLASEGTAFVLVAGPEEQVLGEADFLSARMEELGVPLKGVIMNRVHDSPAGEVRPSPDAVAEILDQLLAAGCGAESTKWIGAAFSDALSLADAEEVRRESFEAQLAATVAVAEVPEQSEDVHDLAHLARLVGYLEKQPS